MTPSIRALRPLSVLLALAAGACAQDYIISWGTMTVDSRWHQRTGHTAVVAGGNLTAAVLADGSIEVIGFVGGDVPSLPPGVQYASMAVEGNQLAALRSDGQIVSWPAAYYVPTAPAGVTFTQIDGDGSFLALRSDGEVVHWGFGGEFAIPPFANPSPAVEIAKGANFQLMRRQNGSIVTWGNPSIVVPALPPGQSWIGMAAGGGHALFLSSQGELFATGDNSLGQSDVPPLPAGMTYTDVWAGTQHSYARRSDGALLGWGDNQSNQLDVPAFVLAAGVQDLSLGWLHSVALLNDGSVACWGRNRSGQCNVPRLPQGVRYERFETEDDVVLGLRTDGELVHMGERTSDALHLVPALPSGLAYTDAAIGDRHCLAVRSDGSVVAWGSNQYGQGNVTPLPPGLVYERVTATDIQSLALRSDGEIVAWGPPDNGVLAPPALPSGVTYVDLDAGRDHVIALRSDGQIVGWGDDDYGELSIPTLPAGVVYERLECGQEHCVAWRTDGQVVAWGASFFGQTNVPPLAAGMTYTGVRADSHNGAASRSDGALRVWGSNLFGQLSVPSLSAGESFADAVVGDSWVMARVARFGTTEPLGAGCAGSLPPATIVPFANARVGAQLKHYVRGLPMDMAFVINGWSKTISPVGPLPLPAAPYGMPGCTFFTSCDLIDFVSGQQGAAAWTANLPFDPALVGVPFHQQALVPDAGVGNPLQAVLSDACTTTVGS